jgi:hypothetical protein
MIKRTSCFPALAGLLIALLAFPLDGMAQGAQSAGKVSNVVPVVNVVRGAQQLPAGAGMPVYWQDSINTGHMARARVALNDGSILNVGQDSNLSIVKHDSSTQQTDLELNFGRVRSQAVHLTKPGASFKIRTPTGVAGVVGTDFFLSFENFVSNLQVFEGSVQFCNLAGVCVTVAAGMMSQIRDPNQPPDAPTTIPTAEVVEAHTTTGLPAGTAATSVVATHSVLMSTLLVLTIVVPTAVVATAVKTNTCGCTTVVATSPKK